MGEKNCGKNKKSKTKTLKISTYKQIA